MKTMHRLLFGDSSDMSEVQDASVHLVVTSPPYFNAPFDYPDLFEDYRSYVCKMRDVAKEVKRVLAQGRIACIVCDDTLVDGQKYPVVADLTKIYIEEGFIYRDRIIWTKPEGYIRISRRSGVLLQHPYPMYFYPDNIQETILIFQNGRFDYKSIPADKRELSKIDLQEYQQKKWYLSNWNIINVLPLKNRLEEGIAAFPEEIPNRLIRLFSHVGEIVLDPFMGSGTTNKVAAYLGRNSIGYEIDLELLEVIKEKLGLKHGLLLESEHDVEITVRHDARRLRTQLTSKVCNKRSVVKNAKRDAKYST